MLLYVALFVALRNIKKSYKNNKFKIPAPPWNEKFELRDGSLSILDIKDYFKYIFKNKRQLLIILQ